MRLKAAAEILIISFGLSKRNKAMLISVHFVSFGTGRNVGSTSGSLSRRSGLILLDISFTV